MNENLIYDDHLLYDDDDPKEIPRPVPLNKAAMLLKEIFDSRIDRIKTENQKYYEVRYEEWNLDDVSEHPSIFAAQSDEWEQIDIDKSLISHKTQASDDWNLSDVDSHFSIDDNEVIDEEMINPNSDEDSYSSDDFEEIS